ncbi:hypothetical protein SEA_STORMINNORM_70 [Gordonia Phage StorminNorm]|uniref:Uncharacterized protein n=4 Tax=Kroosvirus TaxID=2948789 RepID=A0A3G3MAD1_9CAUD|nr:hypothetical protein J1761_gp69 [Gordonia phage Kroos]AYR03048.1 hypothetical protein SEA_KROOS_69 [Gordonia phage Kroos]UTN91724.1 hypothetical protein SEA_STORMINNORM_70 [Gordonia Phage StorminNorm]
MQAAVRVFRVRRMSDNDHLYGDDICQGCLMRHDLCECAE